MDSQKEYVDNYKRNKRLILLTQLLICISFFITWELLTRLEVINTFISSSPSNIIITLKELYLQNNLFIHINTTVGETLIAFIITTVLSLIISIIFYLSPFISKVMDPYLTMLNSLPKVAFGPILIIWIGANKISIVTMAILIGIITSIQAIYNSFINTDKNKIKLFQSFKASKKQILFNVVIPSNYKVIINTLKINIAMSLIGVIMGEFLTSKQGLGYLILYGSQIFNIDLVMSSIFLLVIISILMYGIIVFIEKKLIV